MSARASFHLSKSSARLDRISSHNSTDKAFDHGARPIKLWLLPARPKLKSCRDDIAVPSTASLYGAEDVSETAGIRTTHGSSFFRDNISTKDSECIVRLQEAGAIMIGKCNTHEFAGGSTTINKNYGTARNPWDTERIVGGSSGGSACALAARFVPLALGSDTGGSIRTPAALCGVVGLKPTKGRISLRGIYPNVPTFDHAGPMARTAEDAAIALQDSGWLRSARFCNRSIWRYRITEKESTPVS